MKTVIAAAMALTAALVAATPAAAGYHYVTVDGVAAPGGPAVLATVVTTLNDSKVATGYYITDNGQGQPGQYFAFTVNADGSNFAPFSRPGFVQTGAAGINNAGDVAGVSVTAGGFGTGFVRSGADGSYVDIFPLSLGAIYSEAIGINNSGAVTGYYVTDPAATVATLAQYAHGFIEYGGNYVPVDVDAADGFGTQVTSINDFGLITGSYLDNSADHLTHPFFGAFDPTTGNVFVIPSATDPFGAPASTIGNITNNLYTTYDSIYPTNMSPTGFVSAAYVLDVPNGGVTPINVPGAFFTDIFGINQSRDITGFYLDGTGLHGFVGTFVPEPGTWSLMIAGFGLIGSALRRRARVGVRG